MESVIDKLSEIETAASRIMESAVEETRRQDNAAEERTSTYDNDTDAQAARALEAAGGIYLYLSLHTVLLPAINNAAYSDLQLLVLLPTVVYLLHACWLAGHKRH